MKKKKIFIIVPKFKIGGAEKVMINIANELAKYNLKIFFIILTKSRKITLNKNINQICLQSSKVFYSIFKLKDLINQFKPDLCFSTISHTNIALFIASKFAKHDCKIFLRESNNLFKSLNTKNFLYNFFFLKLVKISYQNSILITPSKELSFSIKKKFRMKQKVFSINNPIMTKNLNLNLKKKFDFINIGSLTYQKDHFTLLEAFRIANLKKKNLKLIIIGEGNLKIKILEYISEYNLKKNVKVLSNQKNFIKYLNQSKIFILSSRYEGYPNVLIDAAVAKLPIITTNCEFGPSEILQKYKYGKFFKVGDYIELSKLMLNNNGIKKLPEYLIKKNNLKKITKKYYELFFKKNIK